MYRQFWVLEHIKEQWHSILHLLVQINVCFQYYQYNTADSIPNSFISYLSFPESSFVINKKRKPNYYYTMLLIQEVSLQRLQFPWPLVSIALWRMALAVSSPSSSRGLPTPAALVPRTLSLGVQQRWTSSTSILVFIGDTATRTVLEMRGILPLEKVRKISNFSFKHNPFKVLPVNWEPLAIHTQTPALRDCQGATRIFCLLATATPMETICQGWLQALPQLQVHREQLHTSW